MKIVKKGNNSKIYDQPIIYKIFFICFLSFTNHHLKKYDYNFGI